MVHDTIEDLQEGDAEFHGVELVVVFRDLVAVSHVDKYGLCDAWVVRHEIRQLGWAHVDVEDHLFVSF